MEYTGIPKVLLILRYASHRCTDVIRGHCWVLGHYCSNVTSSHVGSVHRNHVSSGLATNMTLIRMSVGELGTVHCTGLDLLMISFLYRRKWFFIAL
jgi:hypothetical protein